jgi:hypothetical protein
VFFKKFKDQLDINESLETKLVFSRKFKDQNVNSPLIIFSHKYIYVANYCYSKILFEKKNSYNKILYSR